MRRRAQPWLGTLVEITIADSSGEAELNAAFSCAFAAIAEVHRLMSFHDSASDVSRINLAPVGASVAIHPHTFEVIRTALSVTLASDGIFDIACAPKLVEWGYLPTLEGKLPLCARNRSALILDDIPLVKKAGAAWIDLGGIAKGYAVDMAITALQQSGVQSACVNAGGDLRAFGELAYPVVVRDPQSPTEIGLQTQVKDEAFATSAIYFSRKTIDGREFSALVNGKDGQPVTGRFSTSVRAPSCMLADALTKVVSATANPQHPALQQFGALALIIPDSSVDRLRLSEMPHARICSFVRSPSPFS